MASHMLHFSPSIPGRIAPTQLMFPRSFRHRLAMKASGKTDVSLDRPTIWKSSTDHYHHARHLWLDFVHGSKSRCRGFQPWTPIRDPSNGRFLAYGSCLFPKYPVSPPQYDHWLSSPHVNIHDPAEALCRVLSHTLTPRRC